MIDLFFRGGYMMVHLNKKQAGRVYDFNGEAPGSTDPNTNSNYADYQEVITV